MSPEVQNALRVHTCAIVRELGACLDSLGLAAEATRLPGIDPAADAFITSQHVAEAEAAADSVCQHAADLLQAISQALESAQRAAAPFIEQRKERAS